MKTKLSLFAVVLGLMIAGASCTGKGSASETKNDTTKAAVDTTQHVAADTTKK